MDYTNYLFLGIICAVVALVSLALVAPSKPILGSKPKKQKRPEQGRQNTEVSLVSDLEVQLDSLNKELEKARLENTAIQKELEAAKNSEADMKTELSKREKWDKKEDSEFEKIKKENTLFKEKLTNQSKELEKEISQNFKLDKELKEKKEKLEAVEKENKQMRNELRALKAQVSGYQKETEEQKKAIETAKKKEEESDWISKKEYNELRVKLEAKEAELRKLQGQKDITQPAGNGDEKQSQN